ncbi:MULTISPECIES: helix-turn-helix transcriptional regulator [unclassified Yoonia]|uniref:helix-turn-helix transcriptional regulator n=1 Tax=unclassified Yoonia TaxID=2629118 RepID=UPI002AFDFA84|nr:MULTISPECIES: helix-turn-helix transcriptional regulator [unclassified Yoonia]
MSELLEYLRERQISQRAFARSVGVDPSIISRLVGRTMRPSLDLAVAIERQTSGSIMAASWIEAETAGVEGAQTQEDAA